MMLDPNIGIKAKCNACGHLISQHKRNGCLYVGCKCRIFEVDLHRLDIEEMEKLR